MTAAAGTLAGCVERGRFLPPHPDVARAEVDILVATNRRSLASTDRVDHLSFAGLTIGVPTDRTPGQVPRDGPGAFSVLSQRALSTDSDLSAALTASGDAPLVIWVHGFNNNAAEAIHRQAQMAVDAGLPGPQLAFVWPSAELAGGYLYDRDSALQSRAALAELFDRVPRFWPGDVVVVAHSLGCLLVLEALARLRLMGRPKRLQGLILLQPDISPDVFASQLRDIGPLPPTAVLAIARNDPALRLSALFSGSNERVGTTTDPDDYRGMGFQVVDLTEVADATNPHLIALTSPTVLDQLRRIAIR